MTIKGVTGKAKAILEKYFSSVGATKISVDDAPDDLRKHIPELKMLGYITIRQESPGECSFNVSDSGISLLNGKPFFPLLRGRMDEMLANKYQPIGVNLSSGDYIRLCDETDMIPITKFNGLPLDIADENISYFTGIHGRVLVHP
jgi:hypothetical protein